MPAKGERNCCKTKVVRSVVDSQSKMSRKSKKKRRQPKKSGKGERKRESSEMSDVISDVGDPKSNLTWKVVNEVDSFHDRRVQKDNTVEFLTTVISDNGEDLTKRWFPRENFPDDFNATIKEFETRLKAKILCREINRNFIKPSKRSLTQKFGFQRDLKAEKIVGIVSVEGTVLVEIQWKGSNQTDFELYDEVKKICPSILAHFLMEQSRTCRCSEKELKVQE